MKISKKWLYLIAGVALLWWWKRSSRMTNNATTKSDDLTGMSVINGIKNPRRDLKPSAGVKLPALMAN